MRFALSSFVTLATAALAVAQPSTRAPLSINPDPSVVRPIPDVVSVAAPQPETNAKRFAEGLPPLSPKAHRTRRRPHRGGPHGGSPVGGTKVDTARRSASSPVPPVSAKCNVLAKNGATTLGYLAPTWNGFGEYGQFVPDQASALTVSFSYLPDAPSQIDILATNGPDATYPYVGGAVGFASDSDDFGPGSSNYAYITGTKQTPPGSPAVVGDSSYGTATGLPADYESAIWVYDPTTQAIAAQWINTDGSAPATYLIHIDGVLAVTGDVDAFANTIGPANVLKFVCVPPRSVVPAPEPTFR